MGGGSERIADKMKDGRKKQENKGKGREKMEGKERKGRGKEWRKKYKESGREKGRMEEGGRGGGKEREEKEKRRKRYRDRHRICCTVILPVFSFILLTQSSVLLGRVLN